MKKIFLIFIAFIFLFISISSVSYAAKYEISVTVNGLKIFFDQPPILDENNRTLVPVRFIVESMGADVEWDQSTKTVTIIHEGKTIDLTIGEKKATVNGKVVTFDTAAQLVSDRTLVPVRFISETLGANVDWEQSTRTVIITTSK